MHGDVIYERSILTICVCYKYEAGYIASEIVIKMGFVFYFHLFSFDGSHAIAAPIFAPTCGITRVILLIQLD